MESFFNNLPFYFLIIEIFINFVEERISTIDITTSSQNTTLTIGQLHILEMLKRCKTEKSLETLKKILFDFYVKEAEAEADRLWDEGVISEEKIEEWGEEHMRTPYIHAQ